MMLKALKKKKQKAMVAAFAKKMGLNF